jgi:hypothetical protein
MRIVINMKPGGATRLGRAAASAMTLSFILAGPAAARGQEGASPRLAVEGRLPVARDDSPVDHGKAFTGDATPIEPGHVEVEIAYAPSWWATAGAVDRQAGEQHPVVAALGIGLLHDLDLRLAVGWAMVHATPGAPGAPVHGAGLADTTVAIRWRFLSLADPAIDLAVTAAVTVPTGTRSTPERLGTSRESWSLGGALLASADWGRLTVGAELGFSAPLAQRASNDVGLLVCNVAVGYQLLPWLQPELELNYQHEVELGEERDERVLWATAALVVPIEGVRLLVGGRLPVWSRDTAAGPMATASVKLAF